MIRTAIVILTSISLFAISGCGFGAEEPAPDLQSDDPLTVDRLEDLVATLESETARQEFIENLQTLIAAQSDDEETASLSISDMLHIDETSNSLLNRYLQAINDLGISDSVLGRIAVIGGLALILVTLLFINRKLAQFLNNRLNPLRSRYKLASNRLALLFRVQVWFGNLLGILFFLYALFEVTGLWPRGFEANAAGLTVVRFVIICLFASLFFVLIWEAINALIDYGVNDNSRLSSSRVRTLMPIIRNLALVIMLVLSGIVLLSELGVDVLPLLAGAGVVGIAIGFGAQTMVKDFLNGFVIILEDLLQVGDVVHVGGRTGLVELITLRKVQLRDLDGTVHTVPYSEISVVDNKTKGYSYYLMDVGVAYREDVDEVIKCLREVDEDMRNSDEFRDCILEPLDVLGVNEFADSAVVVRVRTKTRAHDKWKVGREFNRRIKIAFDARNIEIPFPHQTLYFGEDKSGDSPPANVVLLNQLRNEQGNNEVESNEQHRDEQKGNEQKRIEEISTGRDKLSRTDNREPSSDETGSARRSPATEEPDRHSRARRSKSHNNNDGE